jgi:RHS repeat-associated protein
MPDISHSGNQLSVRELNSATSLYSYRARYYDLNVGRFTTEDPLGFRAGQNFYSYVNNNPTTLADPFGLQQEDPNWFFRWGNRILGWLLDPPKPKPGAPQPNPVNICEKGETALFWEAGPNPYYKGGAGRPAWEAFQRTFIQKCADAKKPGTTTSPVCTTAAMGLGPVAYCMCCESCEKKK